MFCHLRILFFDNSPLFVFHPLHNHSKHGKIWDKEKYSGMKKVFFIISRLEISIRDDALKYVISGHCLSRRARYFENNRISTKI